MVQVTAADVIHSWKVPAFGVMQDAVPGRLAQLWFKAEKEGVYYGQCSELCGVEQVNPVKGKTASCQRLHPAKRLFFTVAQVVHDHHVMAALQQRQAAARHDAFRHRGLGGADGVVERLLLRLHLGFRGRADAHHRDADPGRIPAAVDEVLPDEGDRRDLGAGPAIELLLDLPELRLHERERPDEALPVGPLLFREIREEKAI